MSRSILTACVLVLLAPVACVAQDPPAELIGVYFDDFGDQICQDNIPLFVPFSLWIVYTNPSVATMRGYELGYFTTTEFIQLALEPPCGIIWLDPPPLDNLYVDCGEPIPTAPATPLLRIDYMAFGYENPEALYYVAKASGSVQPGDNPHVILADGSFLEVQAQVPAYTTVCCGIPIEPLGWGSVKSLYR